VAGTDACGNARHVSYPSRFPARARRRPGFP
jgi:hypothetical protein